MTALSLVGLLLVLYVGHIAASDGFAYDAHAYWLAQGYGNPENAPNAFVYSPPILLVCRCLVNSRGRSSSSHTPPPSRSAYGSWPDRRPCSWCSHRRWHPRSRWRTSTSSLALVAVFGLRWSALWSFALLTKVTPGVGVQWFAFRGEWRKLSVALGVTAAIAVPTMILAPSLWADWIGVLGA